MRRPSAPPPLSTGEETLALHLRALGVEPPVRQYAFAEAHGRLYRFDFAWIRQKLAVEVDGSVHRIKGRFKGDLERQNIAQALGWRVFRFSPQDVVSGKAVDAVRALLSDDLPVALEALQRVQVSHSVNALRHIAAGVLFKGDIDDEADVCHARARSADGHAVPRVER